MSVDKSNSQSLIDILINVGIYDDIAEIILEYYIMDNNCLFYVETNPYYLNFILNHKKIQKKLHNQEKIWKKICDDLGWKWEFKS